MICITSLIGIFGVSAALEGFLIHRMNVFQRLLCVAGGLLLIYPGIVTDTIGLVLVAMAVVYQLLDRSEKKTAV